MLQEHRANRLRLFSVPSSAHTVGVAATYHNLQIIPQKQHLFLESDAGKWICGVHVPYVIYGRGKQARKR